MSRQRGIGATLHPVKTSIEVVLNGLNRPLRTLGLGMLIDVQALEQGVAVLLAPFDLEAEEAARPFGSCYGGHCSFRVSKRLFDALVIESGRSRCDGECP